MIGHSDRVRLRRILKQAKYVTSDMKAADGPGRQEDTLIIRRIVGNSIFSGEYPASRRQKRNALEAAIFSWENEGGAVEAAHTTGEKL